MQSLSVVDSRGFNAILNIIPGYQKNLMTRRTTNKLIEDKLLLFTRPLPRDGGMAEDHGAQEAGQLLRPGPEVVQRQRVAKE